MNSTSRLDGQLVVEGQIENGKLHIIRKYSGQVQHKFFRSDLYGTSDEAIQIAIGADADFCADYLSWKR